MEMSICVIITVRRWMYWHVEDCVLQSFAMIVFLLNYILRITKLTIVKFARV